ncbi:hypothetical protein OGH69_04030 [Flavobacterium sp. MFBS3-15]|uniref:hypothetical protein n=1 Tax=Flavobacterium sp. MFBS3-15 TaxID=2989816 RepID=UPI002236473F|nr:hypothetical protein [Flavobacterium sp. MFBS3-15]MCW4468124.1 hypothetical protein [Flavobacterium sp. MFBS3-15]
MELKELHDTLIAEGCGRFSIEGVGVQLYDEVDRLEMKNGRWEVNFYQRGQVWETLFSTTDKHEATHYYYNHIMKMQHWHLVAFTRSFDVFTSYRFTLESHGIKTIQNDIPDYAAQNDHVYRLLVVNKDIFKARELFGTVPYLDEDLKK